MPWLRNTNLPNRGKHHELFKPRVLREPAVYRSLVYVLHMTACSPPGLVVLHMNLLDV